MMVKKLLYQVVVMLFFTINLMVAGSGIIDEGKTREFNYYGDNYGFSASAMSGWQILSASASGGSGGDWTPSYSSSSASAYGTRNKGEDSAKMFSACLSGSIRPVGGESSPQSYSYSVQADFTGFLGAIPLIQYSKLWGVPFEPFKLIINNSPFHTNYAYWRTTPNRKGPNNSTKLDRDARGHYYNGDTSYPGLFTVDGSIHADGGDSRTAVLTVIGVKSISAVGDENQLTTSETDGTKRNSFMEQIKDENNNTIAETIPTFYTLQGESVSLRATSTSDGSWPRVSKDSAITYPRWYIQNTSSLENYFSNLYGSSSTFKDTKAFGTTQVWAECGNAKALNMKFIRVKFAKKNIYASWESGSTHDVKQYLAGASALMRCQNPSSCENLQCNHRGVYDTSKFAWNVTGDAELVLEKNGITIYDTTFSPSAENDKTPAEKRIFTGKVRFLKSSMTTEANISVTATSEELAKATDTLSIIPQYLNLTVAGAEEEIFEKNDLNQFILMNKATAESTAGAFVMVNDNDSNQDKNLDSDIAKESTPSDSEKKAEPDLLTVGIAKKINSPSDAEVAVTLTLSKIDNQATTMKVWKDDKRETLLIDDEIGSVTFATVGDVPDEIFVEALGTGKGKLSMSYSYSLNTDFDTVDYYVINSSDELKLTGFKVDATLAGVPNEQANKNEANELVKTLVYEDDPGGTIIISSDSEHVTELLLEGSEESVSYQLIPLDLTGSNLMRDVTCLELADGATHPDLEKDVTFAYSAGKVEFYELITPATESSLAIYRKCSNLTLKVKDLPKKLYMRPLTDSDTKRDVEINLSYTSPQNGSSHEDTIKLTLLKLDVDVDSNNDGTVAVNDEVEDAMETTSPGKIISLNNDDLDGDETIDNVDWEIKSETFNQNIFDELIIRIPNTIDKNSCKITLSYPLASTTVDENGNLVNSTNGSLRIWTKMSNIGRNPAPIGGENQTGDLGGDLVAPTTWEVGEGKEAYYTPAQLGILEDSNTVTLYLEGIDVASSSISVNIQPTTAEAELNYNMSDSVTTMSWELGIILKEAEFTGANVVADNNKSTTGLSLVLNDNFDGMLEDEQGVPIPDNTDNKINSCDGEKTNDIKDLGLLTIKQLPSELYTINKIFVLASGNGKIRLFHKNGDNELFWDSATEMNDATASTLANWLKNGDKEFYMEAYGDTGELFLTFSSTTSHTILQYSKIKLLKITRWLVTHDPKLEAIAQASNNQFKQASLIKNKAIIAYPHNSEEGNYIVELLRVTWGGLSEEKIAEAIPVNDDYYEFRLSATNSGAMTDNLGKIYIIGKNNSSVAIDESAKYKIKIIKQCETNNQVVTSYPIKIGPLLSSLSFTPNILAKESNKNTYKTLDPYTDKFDIVWDFYLGNIVGIDEEGYGLYMNYILNGDLKIDNSTEGFATSFFTIEEASNNTTNGIKQMRTDKEFLKSSSWWSSFIQNGYSLKWEGFTSSIADEEASKVWKFPGEAKNNNEWDSPINVVPEGEYILKLNSTYRYDTTQSQNIEIKFNVKYNVNKE